MFVSTRELDLIIPLNCGQKLFCGQPWKGCLHTPLWLQLSTVQHVCMCICCYIFQDGFIPLKPSKNIFIVKQIVNILAKGFSAEEGFLDTVLGTFGDPEKVPSTVTTRNYGNTKTHSNISVNCASDV